MLHDQKLKFPYITVLATGGHTEIVLCRGVGCHTILGFKIDQAIGTFLDKLVLEFKHFEKTLTDPKQIKAFVESYNAERPDDQKIPDDYFTPDLFEKYTGGPLFEKLAKYGNPREY